MLIDAGEFEAGPSRASEGPVAFAVPPSPLLQPRQPRSRLHNFSFPTGNWGSQRTLRCSNLSLSSDHDAPGSGAPAAAKRQPSPPLKPLLPLKRSPRSRVPKEGEGRGCEEADAERSSSPAPAAAEAAGAARPWNLRTRRAACNAPAKNLQFRSPSSTFASLRAEKMPQKSYLTMEAAKGGSDTGKRRKFSISLTREEIREDFLAILGTKPARRPTKRPRTTQRQLELLYPGQCLSEITPAMYKVDE